MANKYRHEIHNRYEKAQSYGYAKLSTEATPKQVKYARDLFATCDRLGIDTKFLPRNFGTISKCNSVIHALYTLLDKNGYDNKGNKKGEKV